MICWLNTTKWINRKKQPKSEPSWEGHPRYPVRQRTEGAASIRAFGSLSRLLVLPARSWQLIEILHGSAQSKITSDLRITCLTLRHIVLQIKRKRSLGANIYYS